MDCGSLWASAGPPLLERTGHRLGAGGLAVTLSYQHRSLADTDLNTAL